MPSEIPPIDCPGTTMPAAGKVVACVGAAAREWVALPCEARATSAVTRDPSIVYVAYSASGANGLVNRRAGVLCDHGGAEERAGRDGAQARAAQSTGARKRELGGDRGRFTARVPCEHRRL